MPHYKQAGVLGGIPEHLAREACLENAFNLQLARHLMRQVHTLLQGSFSGMAQPAAGYTLHRSQGFGEYRPNPGMDNPQLQVLVSGMFGCPPYGELGLFGPVEPHRKDAVLSPFCGSRHCGLPGLHRREGGTK
jgi:hypothetical protein